MDYQYHYNKLIIRAKERASTRKQANVLFGYSEAHHIIPRCMSGTNEKENLAYLTPEEHYLAHQLLVKIFPNVYGLAIAARQMTISNQKQKRNNKLYGWLRRKHSVAMSQKQSGEQNSQYGTRWITNGFDNCRIKKNEMIPDGWKLGKIQEDTIFRNCLNCNIFLGTRAGCNYCESCRRNKHLNDVSDIERVNKFKHNRYQHSSDPKKEELRRQRISATRLSKSSDKQKQKRKEKEEKRLQSQERKNNRTGVKYKEIKISKNEIIKIIKRNQLCAYKKSGWQLV